MQEANRMEMIGFVKFIAANVKGVEEAINKKVVNGEDLSSIKEACVEAIVQIVGSNEAVIGKVRNSINSQYDQIVAEMGKGPMTFEKQVFIKKLNKFTQNIKQLIPPLTKVKA